MGGEDAHKLDSDHENELELIKHEMTSKKIQPHDEIIANKRKSYGDCSSLGDERSLFQVDYLDYNPSQYKELFQSIRMKNAEREFKIYGIVPPKKVKKIMSAADVLNSLSLKIM